MKFISRKMTYKFKLGFMLIGKLVLFLIRPKSKLPAKEYRIGTGLFLGDDNYELQLNPVSWASKSALSSGERGKR